MLFILRSSLRVYEDSVYKNDHEFIKEFLKHVVHQVFKRCKDIGLSKRYEMKLTMSNLYSIRCCQGIFTLNF